MPNRVKLIRRDPISEAHLIEIPDGKDLVGLTYGLLTAEHPYLTLYIKRECYTEINDTLSKADVTLPSCDAIDELTPKDCVSIHIFGGINNIKKAIKITRQNWIPDSVNLNDLDNSIHSSSDKKFP